MRRETALICHMFGGSESDVEVRGVGVGVVGVVVAVVVAVVGR